MNSVRKGKAAVYKLDFLMKAMFSTAYLKNPYLHNGATNP